MAHLFAIAAVSYAASYTTLPPPTTRGATAARRAVSPLMKQALITDGTDSFFGSRTIFQFMHDFGDYSSLIAFSSSIVDAKKLCISRQARYSGLIDVLQFAEGGSAELAKAFQGVNTWVAVNADEKELPAQLAAASAAGVQRIFVHLSAADSAPGDVAALKTAAESGARCTIMRTGALTKSGTGGGLLLGDIEQPACDEVPIDDAFRFIVEALAIPEAAVRDARALAHDTHFLSHLAEPRAVSVRVRVRLQGRIFSLCPSVDDYQLKQMRMAGCTRREETEALLKGIIVEKSPEARAEEAAAPAAAAAAAEDDGLSDEEKAAKAEEEVKMLLARAREKGVENQKRRAEEEAAKAKAREERLAMFKMPDEDEDDDAKDGGDGASDDGDAPKSDGDAPKKDDDGGGDDDGDDDGDGKEPALL